jgi:4-amino-4-deoxy-L-arabinose transferase-like glycosyltransferase
LPLPFTVLRNLMLKKSPTLLNWLALVWLILICAIAFFWHLGSTGLVDETEPLFAEAARQMTVTGDWITPYYNEATRFDKPPLIYWLMAIGYQILGVNEWAARLPSALAATMLVFFGFYILQRYGFPSPATAKMPEKETQKQRQLLLSAWLGGAFIALNGETIVWARIGVSDMLLTGCMGVSLLCFFAGYAQDDQDKGWLAIPNGWYLAFYIFCALAVLTKGPVGCVLPGLIIFTFLLYMGSFWQVVKEMGVIIGGAIFFALTIPWYVLVILANDDYIDSFFGYHNVERFTSVVNGHAAPWYLYFLVVLVGFAPWSICLPIAMARLKFWRRGFWQRQPRHTHLGIYALFWFASIFIFFTIAVTKIPSYVLPLMPAAAIMVALFWSEEITSISKSKGTFISGVFNVIFLGVLAVALFYSPNWLGFDPAAPTLPERMAQTNITEIGAILWGVVAVAIAVCLFRPSLWRWLWIPNLIGFIAFILFVLTPANFLMDEVRQLPLRELSEVMVTNQNPKEELVMIGFEKPTVVFYTRQSVDFFDTPEEAFPYLESLDQSALVLTRTKTIPALTEGFNTESLGQRGTYEVVRLFRR